jgi:predicted O-linked N-acetylglucosamine transferase (SPINDLY family)
MMSASELFSIDVLAAWNGQLEFGKLIASASQLEAEGLLPLAAVLYSTWVQRNKSPYLHAAYFNLGVTLSNANDLEGAKSAYHHALELSPDFLQPRLNLGSLHERTGEIEKALEQWRWIDQNATLSRAENKPMVAMALNHLGRVLEGKKRLSEALYYLNKSLGIEPNQADVLHHWISLRQKQCIWPVYIKLPRITEAFMRESTSALSMLSITDDPAEQLAAATRFARKKFLDGVPTLANPNGYGHRKIRVGFCSSDFCLHPVSMLTVELYELLDRQRFDVYGYCWSPEDGSDLRKRVIDAMDHFTRIHQMTDDDAAKKIRTDEIDVLIDLQGQTAGARANILAYRPAPIQITYLGLPATTGLSSIDYVIADKFLIPETEARYYSEKPLYMPDVYMVSDRQRKIGPKPSRESCGLPDSGFVFCSFNNNYKFTPEVFSVWMDILQQVPGSVLWLLSDNQWSEDNLRGHAEDLGVDSNRLIFAERVSPESYLARFQVADLFLDTFPFNAGTTANDALWAGLPVLTLTGRSFASRMAGALLTATKIHSLITYHLNEYKNKAIELANDPIECQRIRQILKDVHEVGVLFDSSLFAGNLEKHLSLLVDEKLNEISNPPTFPIQAS